MFFKKINYKKFDFFFKLCYYIPRLYEKGCFCMKKLKTITGYLLWIPFAVSIGAFALYFKYLFTVKKADTAITSAINQVINRYYRIGLFCLLVGLFILIINRLLKIIFNEDKYYAEKYPWVKNAMDKKIIKKNKKINKSITENNIPEINNTEEKIIDDNKIIVNELNEENNYEKEDKYVINENKVVYDKIASDLDEDKIIKARFIEDNHDKNIEVLSNDNEEETEILNLDSVISVPERKNQTIIKVNSSKVKIDGFIHCPKCNNFVVEDAVVCVHCGVLLDESLRNKINKNKKNVKVRKFNGVKFAINAIIIIICFMVIVLLCHRIESQKKLNDKNINSQKVESVIK